MAKSNPLLTRKASSSLINSDMTVSENKASWPMMHVGHYQFSAACETPEHFFRQHFISVHLNHTNVVKEQKLSGRLQCGGFSVGDICLTPATAPVSVNLQAPCELIGLHLESAFFTQLSAEVADSESLELIPQFKLSDPLIYQMAIALKAQIESSGEWSRLYVESMAAAMSVHLLQHYSTRKPKVKTPSTGLSKAGLSKARLGEVLEYIHEHADQNLSLLEMAQQAQMSPYHFSRLFKQSTGLSPHQYLISRRIQQAKQLLATTALSIAEIAAQAGFTDQSHLARHFKRQLGVVPSQFR